MPELVSEVGASAGERGHPGVWRVLAQHRHVLLTLGVVVVVISASRSVRTGLLPLWADHVGISPSTKTLIFALAGAVDLVFFYPGGWLMDHRGRTVVAVPVVLSVAVAALLLPLATSAWSVAAVVVLIAVGNGLGSGIVMVLGADAAPVEGRAQFLGGWRLCGDIGLSGGPLVVSAVAAVAPLAVACVAIGVLGLAGTAWTAVWVGRDDRRLRARRS
jgi:MFS family permease